MKTRIMARLKQPSTIKGIVTLASLAGYTITPDKYDAFMLVAPLAIGLWEFIRNEFKSDKEK